MIKRVMAWIFGMYCSLKICVFMIYLALLSLISLLISKAITTTHMFIRNTSNGI